MEPQVLLLLSQGLMWNNLAGARNTHFNVGLRAATNEIL
jgi:hypothetical protein